MARRSKFEVLINVMRVVAEGRTVRRTHVMYGANLAWKVLIQSLGILEQNGMLESRATPSGVFVSLTSDGYSVLQKYIEIETAFNRSDAGGRLSTGLMMNLMN